MKKYLLPFALGFTLLGGIVVLVALYPLTTYLTANGLAFLFCCWKFGSELLEGKL